MGAGLAAWPNGEPKYPQRDFQSPPLDSLALALTRVPAGLLHRRRRWGWQRTGSQSFPFPSESRRLRSRQRDQLQSLNSPFPRRELRLSSSTAPTMTA
jgi:hypothetical protein